MSIVKNQVDINYNRLEMEPRKTPQLLGANNLSIFMDEDDDLLKYNVAGNITTIGDNVDITTNANNITTNANNIIALEQNFDNEDVKADPSTIDSDDNGLTFYLDNVDGLVVNLPAPFNNAFFKFIVKTRAVGTSNYQIASTGANMYCLSYGSENTDVANYPSSDSTAITNINLIDGENHIGDYVEIVSDGTNYFAKAFIQKQAGITLT
jgi:hypothetical protein